MIPWIILGICIFPFLFCLIENWIDYFIFSNAIKHFNKEALKAENRYYRRLIINEVKSDIEKFNY